MRQVAPSKRVLQKLSLFDDDDDDDDDDDLFGAKTDHKTPHVSVRNIQLAGEGVKNKTTKSTLIFRTLLQFTCSFLH